MEIDRQRARLKIHSRFSPTPSRAATARPSGPTAADPHGAGPPFGPRLASPAGPTGPARAAAAGGPEGKAGPSSAGATPTAARAGGPPRRPARLGPTPPCRLARGRPGCTARC